MNILIPKHYLLITVPPLVTFSVLLLGFPGYVASLLGIPLSAAGSMMLQFLGASLAGHAYLNYRARSLGTEAIKHVVLMNIITLAIAVAVGVVSLLNGTATKIGLLILTMHLTFLLGFLCSLRYCKH